MQLNKRISSGDDSFETYKQRLNDEITELLGVNKGKIENREYKDMYFMADTEV